MRVARGTTAAAAPRLRLPAAAPHLASTRRRSLARTRRRRPCTIANSTGGERNDPFFHNFQPQSPKISDFAIFWPKCFREAATSVNSLQQGHVVVVNVGGIPKLEDQQRAVDFIAGACYALEGQQDVLAESIFIFLPRMGQDVEDGSGGAFKHSQAARDALISLARSELKGSYA